MCVIEYFVHSCLYLNHKILCLAHVAWQTGQFCETSLHVHTLPLPKESVFHSKIVDSHDCMHSDPLFSIPVYRHTVYEWIFR